MFTVIRRLRERGCAVLYISHRIDEIFRIADRVTVMRDGRVINTQAVSETSAAHLIELMTGRNLQQIFPERNQSVTNAPLLQVRICSVQGAAFAVVELKKALMASLWATVRPLKLHVAKGVTSQEEKLALPES